MTRIFHLCAGLLLLATIAFDQWLPALAPVALDPEARLIEVVTAAGFSFDGKHRWMGEGQGFEFSSENCPMPLKIRLFPSIHRDAGLIQALLRAPEGKALLIYRGETSNGEFVSAIGRWALSKAAVLLRLERPSAWDSVVLAASPSECAARLVDWRGLLPGR